MQLRDFERNGLGPQSDQRLDSRRLAGRVIEQVDILANHCGGRPRQMGLDTLDDGHGGGVHVGDLAIQISHDDGARSALRNLVKETRVIHTGVRLTARGSRRARARARSSGTRFLRPFS